MTVNNSGTNKFRNESDLKIDLFLISEKKQKETYYTRRLQPTHLVSCIIHGGMANINFVHNNCA